MTESVAIICCQQMLVAVFVRMYVLVHTLLLEGHRAEPPVATTVCGPIAWKEEPLTTLRASPGQLFLKATSVRLVCYIFLIFKTLYLR